MLGHWGWASLANALAAVLLTGFCFADVILRPLTVWSPLDPAPWTYRTPVSCQNQGIIRSLEGLERKGSPARPEVDGEARTRNRFLVRRGQLPDKQTLTRLVLVLPERRQLDPRAAFGVFCFYFLALSFYTLMLQRYGWLAVLRTRSALTLYAGLLLSALASQLLLSLTPLSIHALPVAFVAILFTPLVTQNIGFGVHLLAVALLAPMVNFTPGLVLVPLISGWTGVLLLNRESGSGRMMLASAAGALMGSLCMVGIDQLLPQAFDLTLQLESDLAGLWIGMLGSGMAASFLYFSTTITFGFIPRSRLGSLLDLNNPLLEDLAEKSPGTFQHSLTLANMAEKVADDIKADALLVRVGAYYHDIGKMQHADYFGENQTGTNPHDRFSPETSAEKLKDHVRYGVTIARGANLPDRIIDFIIEHHGCSTMEYFLHKAAMAGGPPPDISRFSYEGRNPTCRETGILMIVDSMEAASRTLSNPSVEDIETLVRGIMFNKLLNGYLDDSGLTGKDLKRIGLSLIRYLQSQFHVRVEYPWQKKDVDRSQPSFEPSPSGPPTPSKAFRVVKPVSLTPAAAPAEPNEPSELGSLPGRDPGDHEPTA